MLKLSMKQRSEEDCSFMSIVLGKDNKGNEVKMGYGTLYQGNPFLRTTFLKFIDKYKGDNAYGLARHGIYSITARRLNFYIYDHPAVSSLCKTAFTNGEAIFFNADFFKELLKKRQVKTPNGNRNSLLEFVLTHEIAHILKMHFSRLKQYSPEEANLIGDMNINLEIRRMFNWDYPANQVADFVGFRDIDMELYGHLSEESIGRLFMQKRNDILAEDGIAVEEATTRQKMKALKEVIWGKREPENNADYDADGENQESNEGNSEECDETQGNSAKNESPDDNNENEDNAENEHSGDGSNNTSDEHMISNEDLAEALIEAGDKDLADKLGISPDMTDEEKARAIKEAKERLTNALAEAQQERKRAEQKGISLPGGHVESSLEDSLKVDRKPKLDWHLPCVDMLYGNGLETMENDGLMDEICYIEPGDMGLDSSVIIPAQLPFEKKKGSVIFILDTSASMTMDMIEESVAEIKGMLEGIQNEETKVFLVSADTVSRDIALEINAMNVEEKFEELILHGRGGTDLTQGIVSAMELVEAQFPDYPISGIIYGTDLGDIPPKREDLPDNLPQLIFITSPETYNTRFVTAVSEYATVIEIEEGNEATFEDESHMSM